MAPASKWLTGRHRYRVTEEGKLVLQLEEGGAYGAEHWRDASVEDITVGKVFGYVELAA